MLPKTLKCSIVYVDFENTLWQQGYKDINSEFMAYCRYKNQLPCLIFNVTLEALPHSDNRPPPNPILVVALTKAIISAPTEELRMTIAKRGANANFMKSLPLLFPEYRDAQPYADGELLNEIVDFNLNADIEGTHKYALGITAISGYRFDGTPLSYGP